MLLTRMAYQWCAAISEVAGRLRQREIPVIQPRPSWHDLGRTHERALERGLRLESAVENALGLGFRLGLGFGLRLGRHGLALGEGPGSLSLMVEEEFSEVGPSCDPVRLGDASPHVRRGPLGDLAPLDYAHLLSITLEIGFRLIAPGHDHLGLHTYHTSHRDWIFETAFSSHDDEVIADAVNAWTADDGWTPPGSCIPYFTKRVERDAPFSPRLRRVSICAIERIWSREVEVSLLETVHLLNRLEVDVGDMVEEREWGRLLVAVIHSWMGPDSLSSHYWHLLDRLALSGTLDNDTLLETFGVEVARSLEEVESWEKLEACVVIIWWSLSQFVEDTELVEDTEPIEDVEPIEDAEPVEGAELIEDVEPMEDAGSIEDVEWMENIETLTLKLLSQRPSALPRLEDICEAGTLYPEWKTILRRICDQMQAEQSPSGSPS